MRKSNIPTIVIWVFYGLGTGIFLFLVTMSLGSGLGFGAVSGLAAGLVLMLLLGLSVWGIRKKMPGIRPAGIGGRKQIVPVAAESILLIACLVGMTALRMAVPQSVLADPVFETAKVTGEGFGPATAHGGMGVYLWLLHGTLLLLGNNAFAATVLQALLMAGAAFSMYCGVRKLSGIVPALATVLFVGFAPYMLSESQKLTPLPLFLIVYGLALRWIAGLPERMVETRYVPDKIYAGLHYLLTGILLGLCCYLDAAGITLLIFLTGIVCFGDTDKAVDGPSDILGNSVLVFVCCVLVAMVGYVACHGIRSLGGGSLATSLSAQLELYLPGAFRVPVTTDPGAVFWDVPVLAALMVVGVFGFWYSRRIRDKALWLFAAVLLILMQCFGMSSPAYFNAYALLYLFCAGMAGCSVSDLFVMAGKEAVPEEAAETQSDANLEMLDLKPEEAPTVNYIENPLPLPKKKEHRALDYDYEVADDDDFDIQ